MRRIFFSLIISSLALFLFPSAVFAQNKLGVNIGDRYSKALSARSLVGKGGWIVTMGTPGNCSDFEAIFGLGANIVIRGDHPGLPLNDLSAREGDMSGLDGLALSWAAMLGNMDAKGQKVYFMPVNEPVHSGFARENVKFYTDKLKYYLSEAGLLGSKVSLLSPMFDQHNPGYDHYVTNGLGFDYYKEFHGSSVNLYHIFGSGNPRMQYSGYDQFGIPGPYYAVEAGVAGTCSPPCYDDGNIATMLREALGSRWQSDGNFKMFAVFSYDPHRPGAWSIFNASQTKAVYNDFRHEADPTSGGYDRTHFEGWRDGLLNQGILISCDGCGLVTDPRFCEAAGGEVVYDCSNIAGGHFEGECFHMTEFREAGSKSFLDTLWDRLWATVKSWFGKTLAVDFDSQIKITDVEIPIEGHLDFIHGYYDGGEFVHGPIFNLSPPQYTEQLAAGMKQYREQLDGAKVHFWTNDFDPDAGEEFHFIDPLTGEGSTDQPKETESVTKEIGAPELWGDWKTATGSETDPSLFNFLAYIPGSSRDAQIFAGLDTSSSYAVRPGETDVSLASASVLGASWETGLEACEDPRIDAPTIPYQCLDDDISTHATGEINTGELSEDDVDCDQQKLVCKFEKDATVGSKTKPKLWVNIQHTTRLQEYAGGMIATLSNFIPFTTLSEMESQPAEGTIEWQETGGITTESSGKIEYKNLGTVQSLIEAVQKYSTPPSWKQ